MPPLPPPPPPPPMNICRAFSRKRRTGSVPVFLNVYDLTPINGYAYWIGLGVYHSGVEVHGVEYAYGAHDHPTSGIFEGEPKLCPGFQFRKSILIGRTDMGPREVRAFMDSLAEEYTGNTYHLISKNCNRFCDDFCLRLTGNSIPRWVNRLANLGLLCNCVLPVGLHVAGTGAKDDKTKSGPGREEEKRKLRNCKSERYTVNSPACSPPSSPPSNATNNMSDLSTAFSGSSSIMPSVLRKSRRHRSSSSLTSLVVTPSSAPV